jgi:transposase InsO family protein
MILRISANTGSSTRRICDVLAAPRSTFYHAASPTQSQLSDQQMGAHIERIFRTHRRRYGYRRILEELADEGHVCAPSRVRRLMAQRGLRAIAPRHFVPRTSDGRADCPSPNLLLNTPLPTKVNQVLAGDITFIPTSQGWLYLAVVIDLCSRKIIGWALADHLRSELVIKALGQALGSRPTLQNAIFHSDRGSQYGSAAFRALLKQAGMRQSMSARANPYHNAWTESVIGTIKTEMLQGGSFIDESDAKTELFAYIEAYYNTRRKHSSLGHLSPFQFESLLSHNN